MEGLDEQKPPCIFCGCFSSNKRHKAVAKLWSRHNQSLSNLSLRCRQVIKLLPCGCKATVKQSTSCQQEGHQHINIFLEGIFSSIFTPFKKKKTGGRLSLRGGCFGSTGGTQSLQHRPTFPPTCFAKTKPMRKNILPPISFKKTMYKRQKM